MVDPNEIEKNFQTSGDKLHESAIVKKFIAKYFQGRMKFFGNFLSENKRKAFKPTIYVEDDITSMKSKL